MRICCYKKTGGRLDPAAVLLIQAINMKNDYTLKELQKGIDSNDIEWGERDRLPNRFEFPALCRMAWITHRTEPRKEVLEKLFPNGFIIQMESAEYSTMRIFPKMNCPKCGKNMEVGYNKDGEDYYCQCRNQNCNFDGWNAESPMDLVTELKTA